MATYRLSNRQRKDLLIRATGLVIAIPQPYSVGDEDDPVEFARHSLPDDGDTVESAEWEDIAVQVPAGGAALTGIFGTIIDPPELSENYLHVVVRVALVRLAATNERRSHSTPQWPGTAIAGGEQFPRATAAGNE